MPALKIGDKLPSVNLYEGTPGNKVNIAELFAGVKKGVIFAVPGAYTPSCSKTHLPGYVEQFDLIKSKGVDLIVCISVNDPFVLSAWGDFHKATGKIRMLADTTGEFTKTIDMEIDLSAHLGNVRSKRYSLIVENGAVTKINVEPDGTGITCSLAPEILKQL